MSQACNRLPDSDSRCGHWPCWGLLVRERNDQRVTWWPVVSRSVASQLTDTRGLADALYGLRTARSYRRDTGSADSPLGASDNSARLEIVSRAGPDLSERC
jgi:hypothetical protein